MVMYKAEIVKLGVVMRTEYYNTVSQPRQAVRDISEKSGDLDEFVVNVVNDSGRFWKFAVGRGDDGKLHMRNMSTNERYFNRDEIFLIFNNNMRID